jgi:hypothetical protein
MIITMATLGCAPTVVSRAIELDPNTLHYRPTAGAEMQPAFDSLSKTLEQGGWTVQVQPGAALSVLLGREDEQAPYGINLGLTRTIYINGDHSVNTQFETLAHEAGHIFHSGSVDRPTAEVFAELVGNRVQRFYGSRTAVKTSSDYLAHYKHAFASLPFLQADMDRAVRVLTGKEKWPNQ